MDYMIKHYEEMIEIHSKYIDHTLDRFKQAVADREFYKIELMKYKISMEVNNGATQ